MTVGGVLASFFPAFYFLLNLMSLIGFVQAPGLSSFACILFSIYLVPLILYRLHSLFFKIEEGEFDLSKKVYNPWWTAHMLQYPFIALPFLESLLHFFPGLYSIWLRAWGSKIGKKIFWTPRTEILDRNLVEIGDQTIIGHLTIMVSHLVETRSGIPNLVIKKVRIGEKCLISADAQLGPGAEVPSRTQLKPKTRLYWKGEWK
ncbi:MAG: hypothetical protein B7Y39_15880 [Bdellovibrio sp. 28-41-41]|nr:MAG: hypothetical protein B7Y39_15880 [Bdellovibrio sp. 28-41-41]